MVTSLGFLSLASVALGAAVGTWLEAEYLQRRRAAPMAESGADIATGALVNGTA